MQEAPLMPREKLLKFGAAALTDHELLAIFLRTGIKNCPVMQLSQEVLQHFLLNGNNFVRSKVLGLLNLFNCKLVQK